jgi:hypothetical protein
MTYRVAVIQNETELLRYSYADVRQLLSRENYDWSYYTSENIGQLSATLQRYDAIVIATNACNNSRILGWLVDNSVELIDHLERNNAGLFVGFQMALSDKRGNGLPFGFLPEPYQVAGRYRFTDGELSNDGQLMAGDGFTTSSLAALPQSIDIEQLEADCKANPNVPGLYWGYLSDFSSESYMTILQDGATNPVRPLLIASFPDLPRIVLSALVVDWQGIDGLWTNLIRYVVEGDRPVALVSKKGAESFNLDVVQHSLREHKIPQHGLAFSDLTEWNQQPELFAAVVLDPAWPRDQVEQLIRVLCRSDGRRPNLHYFDTRDNSNLIACSLPASGGYEAIIDGATAWLKARWPGDLWDGSFWASFDVLDFFRENDVALEIYREPVTSAIKRHTQSNGSYDDVPGATCAALQVYSWFGEASEEAVRAKQWLLEQIPVQNLYNSATVLETSCRIDGMHLEHSRQRNLVNRIASSSDSWTPGLETLRYMRTLVAVGEYEIAARHVGKLRPAATGRDEWLTIFGAAETVAILLELYANLGSAPDEVEQLVFSGVEYLLEEYDASTGTWSENTVATAKAAKALVHFTSLSAPAVSETIRSITESRQAAMRTHALAGLRSRNDELNLSLAALREQLSSAARGEALRAPGRRRTENAAMVLIVIAYVAVMALALSIVGARDSLDNLVATAGSWREISIPLVGLLALLPAYVVVRMLDAFERDPRWLVLGRRYFPVRWIFGEQQS